MLLFVVMTLHSCDEEDYKDMNITKDPREAEVKSFTGNINGHIAVLNSKGEMITDVDMGGTFYLVDNTDGGANTSAWTITNGDETITSDKSMVEVSFRKPGTAAISLTSTRSADGTSITTETALTINKIPLTVGFVSSVDPVNDVINIKTGDYILYNNATAGSPDGVAWEFDGGTPAASTEETVNVRYETAGVYNVTLTATREDGPGDILTSQVVKNGFVNVIQRVVKLVRAVATDNKIELQFNEPMAQDVPASAISEFSLKINTMAGGEIIPTITAIESTGDSAITLTFNDQMYSDDEVIISYVPTGILKDATGLHNPEPVLEDVCVYGHNMLVNTDMEDPDRWIFNSSHGGGTFAFVNESSMEYPMKPYQGNTCAVIVKGDNNVSVSVQQGFNVAEGDVVEFAYEAQRIGNVGGALERRISTVSGNGSNDAGGNWSSANQGGVGAWVTVKKTLHVSADTKFKTGTLYFNFMRYNGTEDGALWVDNLRIYVPNPRP